MRGRLTISFAAAGVALVVMAASVGAQSGDPGGGIRDATDQEATGDLLPGGGGAQVGAGFQSISGGGGGSSGAGSASGGTAGTGGSGPRITCEFAGLTAGIGGSELTASDLMRTYERRPGPPRPVRVIQVCSDENGQIVSSEIVNWSPPATGGAGGAPVLVDPRVLAEMARSRLVFPAPAVSTSPPPEAGTYAQLPTFFFVENWAGVSASASAGPVTSTVTATPVRQTWTIHDTFRGGTETVSCDGPGAAFDPSRPYEAQVPPPCGWTPGHSSAGQRTHGGPQGEACFPTTVTLAWDVGWGSNIGAGGALGEGTSSSEVCLVAAELQSLVVDR